MRKILLDILTQFLKEKTKKKMTQISKEMMKKIESYYPTPTFGQTGLSERPRKILYSSILGIPSQKTFPVINDIYL